MKKITKIIVAAAILLSGLVLTGCAAAENIKEAFTAPKDTWFRKEVTYKTGSGENEKSTELVVFMCYSDTGYTADDLRDDITLESGLTVVVISKNQGESNPIVDGLVKNKFIIKTFSDKHETEIETGSDDEDTTSSKKTIKMSPTKWNLIYNSVEMEKKSGTINPLQEDSAWDKLEKPTSFSWKKIMANYVLDKLIEE